MDKNRDALIDLVNKIRILREHLKNPKMIDKTFGHIMQIVKNYEKKLKHVLQNEEIVIDLMEVLLTAIKNYTENGDCQLQSRSKDLAKIFVFFVLSLNAQRSDEFVRSVLNLWFQFMNLTIIVPRPILFSKVVPFSKLPSFLVKKLIHANTYLTQQKIVKIWVNYFKEMTDKEEAFKFSDKEQLDMHLKRTFSQIGVDNFDENCRVFLNRFNSLSTENCGIFSISARLMEINQVELPDNKVQHIWLDFNSTYLTIIFVLDFGPLFNSEVTESKVYHVQIDTYDFFEKRESKTGETIQLTVSPKSYKIMDQFEENVENIELNNLVFELKDKEPKMNAFREVITDIYKNRTKIERQMETFIAWDNESVFSDMTRRSTFGTPSARPPSESLASVSYVMSNQDKNNESFPKIRISYGTENINNITLENDDTSIVPETQFSEKISSRYRNKYGDGEKQKLRNEELENAAKPSEFGGNSEKVLDHSSNPVNQMENAQRGKTNEDSEKLKEKRKLSVGASKTEKGNNRYYKLFDDSVDMDTINTSVDITKEFDGSVINLPLNNAKKNCQDNATPKKLRLFDELPTCSKNLSDPPRNSQNPKEVLKIVNLNDEPKKDEKNNISADLFPTESSYNKSRSFSKTITKSPEIHVNPSVPENDVIEIFDNTKKDQKDTGKTTSRQEDVYTFNENDDKPQFQPYRSKKFFKQETSDPIAVRQEKTKKAGRQQKPKKNDQDFKQKEKPKARSRQQKNKKSEDDFDFVHEDQIPEKPQKTPKNQEAKRPKRNQKPRSYFDEEYLDFEEDPIPPQQESKKTTNDDEDFVFPEPKSKVKEQRPKRNNRKQKSNTDDEDDEFFNCPRAAKKTTKKQTKRATHNKKVEQTETTEDEVSTTKNKTRRKSVFKKGYTDMSSLESDQESMKFKKVETASHGQSQTIRKSIRRSITKAVYRRIEEEYEDVESNHSADGAIIGPIESPVKSDTPQQTHNQPKEFKLKEFDNLKTDNESKTKTKKDVSMVESSRYQTQSLHKTVGDFNEANLEHSGENDQEVIIVDNLKPSNPMTDQRTNGNSKNQNEKSRKRLNADQKQDDVPRKVPHTSNFDSPRRVLGEIEVPSNNQMNNLNNSRRSAARNDSEEMDTSIAMTPGTLGVKNHRRGGRNHVGGFVNPRRPAARNDPEEMDTSMIPGTSEIKNQQRDGTNHVGGFLNPHRSAIRNEFEEMKASNALIPGTSGLQNQQKRTGSHVDSFLDSRCPSIKNAYEKNKEMQLIPEKRLDFTNPSKKLPKSPEFVYSKETPTVHEMQDGEALDPYHMFTKKYTKTPVKKVPEYQSQLNNDGSIYSRTIPDHTKNDEEIHSTYTIERSTRKQPRQRYNYSDESDNDENPPIYEEPKNVETVPRIQCTPGYSGNKRVVYQAYRKNDSDTPVKILVRKIANDKNSTQKNIGNQNWDDTRSRENTFNSEPSQARNLSKMKTPGKSELEFNMTGNSRKRHQEDFIGFGKSSKKMKDSEIKLVPETIQKPRNFEEKRKTDMTGKLRRLSNISAKETNQAKVRKLSVHFQSDPVQTRDSNTSNSSVKYDMRILESNPMLKSYINNVNSQEEIDSFDNDIGAPIANSTTNKSKTNFEASNDGNLTRTVTVEDSRYEIKTVSGSSSEVKIVRRNTITCVEKYQATNTGSKDPLKAAIDEEARKIYEKSVATINSYKCAEVDTRKSDALIHNMAIVHKKTKTEMDSFIGMLRRLKDQQNKITKMAGDYSKMIKQSDRIFEEQIEPMKQYSEGYKRTMAILNNDAQKSLDRHVNVFIRNGEVYPVTRKLVNKVLSLNF